MDFRLWLAGLVVVTLMRWISPQQPGPLEMIVSGEWLFRTGDAAAWKDSETFDADWSRIRVPASWESQGYTDYDGTAWYRKHIVIPADWKHSAGILFDLGKIDDEDQVFFNGRQIGSGTGWEVYRKYPVPLDLVRFGEDNVIAIRVADTGGNGGFWEGPVKLVTGVFPRFNVEEY